ncbi:MAG: UDP-N-acetylmuramate--L-alanine ligase [Thermoleophilaceae bacterium]
MSAKAWAERRLHFIGIGGAGMSGLALVARALGAAVSGSDRAESSYSMRLRSSGIEPAIGHAAAQLPTGAEVVVSTAIAADNPELAAARSSGATVLHRADLLAQVARLKRCVAIAGTHGKTTTASMAAHVLVECGHDPSYLIGGELRSTATNAAWGSGEWLVVEADESDRSFLKLSPQASVITNIELDHHSTYRSLREVEEAFADFARRSERTLVPIGWEGVASAETFGIGGGDLHADALELRPTGARFAVAGTAVELGIPGRHNVLNALAAIWACRAAGVDTPEAAAALRSFTGARRRFELKGRTPSGATVYDDYAHHPTEVAATLDAARTLGAGRVVACFQPHLYSRTRRLAREFGQALALADLVTVLDVYPARERAADFPGTSGLMIARATADAAAGRRVLWTPSETEAVRLLRAELHDGDILITMGAGDVDRVAEGLV